MENEFVKIVYFDAEGLSVTEMPPASREAALSRVQALFKRPSVLFAQMLGLDGKVLANLAPNPRADQNPNEEPFYIR